jgi:hypothetical protein
MDWAAFQKRVRAPHPDELDELAQTLISWNCFMKGIAPELIRRVLSEPIPPHLVPGANKDLPTITRNLVYLKEAVPLDALERWPTALQVLRDVQSYTWGSKQRRAKLDAIVATPWQLQAIQAAVVSIRPPDYPGLEFMAVLALDGSDASADALMPHVHHAMTTGVGLEQLERLKKYTANTVPMRAMLTTTEKLLSERSATSPVIALLHDLGIEVDACSFTLTFGSRENRSDGVPKIQVNFSLESRSVPYVHVSLHGPGGETSFNEIMIHNDALGLGRPELAGLAEFFARAARKLDVTWNWDEAWVYSTLRGRKRKAMLDWLRSGQPAAAARR